MLFQKPVSGIFDLIYLMSRGFAPLYPGLQYDPPRCGLVALAFLRRLLRPRLYYVILSGLFPYRCRPKTTAKLHFQHFKIDPRGISMGNSVYQQQKKAEVISFCLYCISETNIRSAARHQLTFQALCICNLLAVTIFIKNSVNHFNSSVMLTGFLIGKGCF